MMNNRQAGRRNRGRNNGRPNNGGNRNGENGNRIDSRARGNAPQLLEKYRNLARDAQLAGDRVNTEYYLQFADHYFRVIADNRARQEEQQARFRRPDEGYEDEGERGFSSYDDGPLMTTEADRHQQPSPSGEGEDGFNSAESDMGQTYSDRGQRQERPRRDTREPRQQREYREPRQQREPRQWEPREDRGQRNEQPQAEQPNDQAPREEVAREEAPRPQRGRRPRREKEESAADAPGLDLAVLPPSISKIEVETNNEETPVAPAAEEAPAPKRRGRPRKVVAEAAE
ncbi:MAG: DUF4167 domain-containing protein [Sphingomonadaceae bacterium]